MITESRLILLLLTFFLSGAAIAVEVGSQSPSCEATFLSDGQPFSLERYKNRVLYIDFWATWCPPCKKSVPFLKALHNEFVDKGFEVIAINVDENADDTKRFLEKYPVNYVIAMDPAGNCPTAYNVMAMPSSYFVDRKGIVRGIHLGFRTSDEADIRQQISSLLDEEIGNP